MQGFENVTYLNAKKLRNSGVFFFFLKISDVIKGRYVGKFEPAYLVFFLFFSSVYTLVKAILISKTFVLSPIILCPSDLMG